MTTKITEQNISNLANLGVQWQAVVTASTLNASAGKGYFIDTSSNACTVTITASGSATAGDTIVLKDYARNWGTNAVTIASNKFDGVTNTPIFNTEGQTVTLVHMGATKGWSLINEDTTTGLGATFIEATGGTVATSGNYKIHSFTGDGNFVVSNAGNSAGSNKVSYLVVAGGGGGGAANHPNGNYASGAGGGAGGFREGKAPAFESYTVSPLAAPDGLTVSTQTYPVTVGGGGPASPGNTVIAGSGSNSVFSTITSAGGGGGAAKCGPGPGANGGSGGGGGYGPANTPGGTGNTPPVSPPQGNNGGTGNDPGDYSAKGAHGAGGGGATAVGANTVITDAGDGGAGATTHITGSPVAYAGGGGGGVYKCGGCHGANGSGAGGAGGGGPGGPGAGNTATGNGQSGTANTGGGAGGGSTGNNGGSGPSNGGTGGKGIVVIRYKFQ